MARGRPKTNHTGACEMVAALGDRVAPEHEALVVMVKALARAVDAEPSNASLWREYRGAVAALMEAAVDDSDDESADTVGFLAAVRTPMGDTA